jgi:hypothetical protein
MECSASWQRILAIAERERRMRAQKDQSKQTQPSLAALGKDRGRELDTPLCPIKRSTDFR